MHQSGFIILLSSTRLVRHHHEHIKRNHHIRIFCKFLRQNTPSYGNRLANQQKNISDSTSRKNFSINHGFSVTCITTKNKYFSFRNYTRLGDRLFGFRHSRGWGRNSIRNKKWISRSNFSLSDAKPTTPRKKSLVKRIDIRFLAAYPKCTWTDTRRSDLIKRI